MSLDGWITLAVVVIAIYAMARELLAPAVAMMGATVTLLLVSVISVEEAFSGFSNPATLTIAALYVLAAAATRAGAFQPLVTRALGAGRTDRMNLARLLPPVAGASAVLNNTPVVAMLVPEVSAWADRHGRSISRLLMPISFAAILGGTLTLIGTSTNLVVSGLLAGAGEDPLGFFELTLLALPIAVAGTALVIALTPRALVDRVTSRQELTELTREFVVDMVVTVGGQLDGKTVEEGGLRHLAGVFLAQIERNGDTVAPVGPTTALRGGDRLRFVGKANDVVDLLSISGLDSGERDQVDGFDLTRSNFFEAVIGASSPMVGQTLRDARFRGRYQAAVVAIHRAGHRVDAKLGDVTLRIGDTLVLLADRNFRDRWRDRRDFLLISPLGEAPTPASRHRTTVLAIVAAVVVIAAATPVPILNAALLGAGAVLVLRIVTPGQAIAAVDLSVVLLVAAGFGLGEAITRSGLAETLADGLVTAFSGSGGLGTLIAVTVVTMILTETVTNTAAAFLVFPIALAAATSLGLDVRGLAIAIALGASASFLTPVGYQTNLMVYGPGGYRYRDYSRLGLPLTILVVVGIAIGVPLIWPL